MSLTKKHAYLFSLAIALSAPLGVAAGCAAFGSSGPSAVSQGQAYSTGNPTFDQFFTELHTLQVELGEAPQAQAATRQPLATAVDAADTNAETLIAAVKKRTDALGDSGAALRLTMPDLSQLRPDATPPKVELAQMGNIDSAAQTLLQSVEKTANDELALLAKMRGAKQRIDLLPPTAINLESQVDSVFRKSLAQKSEVRKNLEDAKKLIPLMSSRAGEVAQASEAFLSALKPAIDHNVAEFDKPPPAPPPAETEEGDAESSGSKSSKPKSSGKPAPKPSSGGFEP